MFCVPFRATMSIYACVRRQLWSKEYYQLESTYDHSLITCRECDQGRQIKINFDLNLDRDFHSLKKNHLKIIKERGWVFKESIPLETLLDNYDYTMMKGINNEKQNSNGFTGNRRITGFVYKHRNIARTKQDIFKPIRLKLTIK